MTIKEAKQITEDYDNLYKENYKYGYYAHTVNEMKSILTKLEVMGLEWGDSLVIPNHFRLTKGYYLTNSKTHYKEQDDEWYIQWDNGNIGRLQFISEKYYAFVEDEWEAFKAELLSYNPLDYDPLNNHIIYDIENGKKVMANYKDICKRTQEAMNAKVKEAQIKEMEEQLAKLKGQNKFY